MTTRHPARIAITAALAVAAAISLSGCSPQFPTIAGVWKASDGTANKTISDDGNCTNLLYTAASSSAMLKTDAPGMCHVIRTATDGAYVFQVHQASIWRNYVAKFSDDDKTISLAYHEKHFVTLTLLPSAH